MNATLTPMILRAQSGQKDFSLRELLVSGGAGFVVGGAVPMIFQAVGKLIGLDIAKMKTGRSQPSDQAPQPFKVTRPTGSATEISLTDDLPALIKGKTEVRVGDSLKFTSPSARSMTLLEVESWFQTEMAKLGTMVDTTLPLKWQVEQAYALKEQLLAGANAALKHLEDAVLFRTWHPTTTLERLESALSKEFSGNPLYEQQLKRIKALENAERIVTREDGTKAISRSDLEGVCFYGETKVIVENGDLEDIQYISPGRMVLSRCEKTGETAYRKVLRNIYREAVPSYKLWMHGHTEDDIYSSYGLIIATAEHPFWVKGKGWVPLSELQPGDPLVISQFSDDVRVRKVEFNYPTSYVHNLEVEEFNTFFVTEYGVWVHNCNTKDARAWELLPTEGGAGRVLESALFRGKSVTPNRAALEAELMTLDSVTNYQEINKIRSTLAELDWTEAFARVGKDSVFLPEANKTSEALRNRLGKLENPKEPWDLIRNRVNGNPDLLVDGGLVMDIYAPRIQTLDANNPFGSLMATVAQKSELQSSAVGIRLTAIDTPNISAADIIRAIEQATTINLGTAEAKAVVPPGLRDLYILDQNNRMFHIKFPDTPKNKPVYGQIDLATGETFRLTSTPAEGQTFLNRSTNQDAITQGSTLGIVPLTQEDIAVVFATARQYWIDVGMPAALPIDFSVGIGNLPVGVAAETAGHRITLSIDGAGWGWYADSTPSLQDEFLSTAHATDFVAAAGGAAEGKLDLLTVLIHELGHVAGLGHANNDSEAMSQVVSPGIRRLPGTGDMSMLQTQLAAQSVDLAAQPHETPVRMVWRTLSQSSMTSGIPQYDIAANPTLTSSQLQSATGWATTGNVTIANGDATLTESATTQTRLNQVFIVGPTDRFLSFTLAGINLDDQSAAPDDAFEAALLDANTGLSLLGSTGLTHNDAFLNLQADGTENKASGITSVVNADGSRTYLVDLAGIPAGTAVNLSFDLLGFGTGTVATGLPNSSHLTIRNLALSQAETKDDSLTLNEDTPTLITVLENDLLPVGAGDTPFAPTLVAAPIHGQAFVNADGSFTYTPEANYHGTDSFTYRVSNGQFESNVATVSLTIAAVNDAPLASNATVTVVEDDSSLIDLVALASDVDSDSTSLVASIVAAPLHGQVVVNADGSFSYAAAADYNGTDSFTYKVSDGEIDSNIATVNLTITAVNDAPVANDATVTLSEDATSLIDLVGFASDIDSATLTALIVASPTHGSLTQNADGSYSYVPEANYNGTDSFSYKVNDGELDSNLATVTLTVAAVNDAAVASDAILSLVEDGSSHIDLVALASDIDSATLTVSIVAGPQHGQVSLNADGSFTYRVGLRCANPTKIIS